MGKWKQISGDMTWEKHGCLLAKVDTDNRSIEVVRIDPWAEHDHSAQLTHGLYLSDEGYFDYDDFDAKKNEDKVESAASSAGMDIQEFKKLPVEGKVEVFVGYGGLDGESKSTNSLLEALPDKPENIAFWGGPETTEKVEQYARDERREALEHHFDTRVEFGEMPDKAALKFAWGDDDDFCIEFQMDDDDRSALGYAKLFSKIPVDDHGQKTYKIEDLEDFEAVVKGLARAEVPGDEMTYSLKTKLERYLGYPEPHQMDEEAMRENAVQMAENAHALAIQLMETLGFDWS